MFEAISRKKPNAATSLMPSAAMMEPTSITFTPFRVAGA
jgi:hypothetical protein